MRKARLPSILALLIVLALQAPPLDAGGDVNEAAPDFSLRDTEGTTHTLSQYRGRVVVLEWINPGCPFSMRHITSKTMIELNHRFPAVVWLAINSTSPEHKDYLDARAHQSFNQEHGIDYPVLLDPSGEVGHAYGAKTTPHMFVIDEEGVILYNGAIDDDAYGKKSSPTNYVALALENLAVGEVPDPAATKPYGCSVKYPES